MLTKEIKEAVHNFETIEDNEIVLLPHVSFSMEDIEMTPIYIEEGKCYEMGIEEIRKERGSVVYKPSRESKEVGVQHLELLRWTKKRYEVKIKLLELFFEYEEVRLESMDLTEREIKKVLQEIPTTTNLIDSSDEDISHAHFEHFVTPHMDSLGITVVKTYNEDALVIPYRKINSKQGWEEYDVHKIKRIQRFNSEDVEKIKNHYHMLIERIDEVIETVNG